MIKLEFNEPQDAPWVTWLGKCKTDSKALIASYQQGKRVPITTLYRQERLRFHQKPFYGKCAYCEAKVVTTSPDYVEHFRPKGEVRDIDNQIVRIKIDGTEIDHPGYYWLSYDWKNLLPTCWNCNTRHKDPSSGNTIGKGTRFPVEGEYAKGPGEELNENPLLIHPVFEDPSSHLEMDALGILHEVNGSVKGSTTIAFFGLNVRQSLVDERKRVYDTMRDKMKLIFINDSIDPTDKGLAEILSIIDGKEEFTIAAKKAIADVLARFDGIKQTVAKK